MTSEWTFAPASVEQIRGFNLLHAASDIQADRLAHQLLVTIVRFQKELRRALEGRSAEWEVTSEQGAMLDVEPLKAVLATPRLAHHELA